MAERSLNHDEEKKPTAPKQDPNQTLNSSDVPVDPEKADESAGQGDPQQTVDSVELPLESGTGKNETDTTEKIMQTVDSVELPADSSDQPKSDTTESDSGQTLDSVELPPDVNGEKDTRPTVVQTVGSTELPDDSVGQPKSDPAVADVGQTVDSVELPLESSTGSESESADEDIVQTWDSTELPLPPSPSAEQGHPTPGKIDATVELGDEAIGDSESSSSGAPAAQIDQTVELGSDGAADLESGGAMTPDGKIDQTVELGPDGAVGAESGGATTPDGKIDQTAELGPDGAVGAASGGATTPAVRIDQTVDLSTAGGPQPSGQDIGSTLDSTNIPDAPTEEMTAIWGDDVNASRPGMTIKGKQGATVTSRSTLVIQPRGFRAVDKGKPGDYAKRADYDLLNLLGEGGMGVVYMARQASIDRKVAIKMLKTATSKDETQRRKFLSEAVITGDLDHPHIVPIYDLGTNDEGALFYSMKRVQGTPWDERVNNMSLHENIETLMKVADAVAFAHSRGVVHRDLKPENTMLGDFGEVLVMDWGLAIPTDRFKKSKTVGTSKTMGGTPAYMAPEMATGPFDKISYTSDVYLLGAMLYEVVTGSPPHTGRDVMKCLVAASKNDITSTEKKGELVDIALKAMSTKPEDRYASVQEFQTAIRDYLDHSESIALAARAEEDLEKAEQTGDYQVYAQSVFGYQEALKLWDGNKRAEGGLRKAKLAYAQKAFHKGDFDLGAGLLILGIPEHDELSGEIQLAQQEREARQQRLKRAKRIVVGLVALVFVVVTGFLVWVNHERQRAEDNAAEARRQEIIAEEKRKEALRQQAIAEANERKAKYEAYVASIGLAAAKIEENSFDAARELLRACKRDTPKHCNWEWGRLDFLCGQGKRVDALDPLQAVDIVNFFDVDMSLNRERLVSGGWNGMFRIWNIGSDGKPEEPLEIRHGRATFVNAVAFSPDGKLVATGSNDTTGVYLRLWDADTGEQVRTLEGHEDTVWSATFSKDGTQLLTSSYDKTARLWDVATGRLVTTFRGHDDWVWSVAFSTDETRVVTASQDGSARVWDKSTGEQIAEPFIGHRKGNRQTPIYTAAFHPNGNLVASGGLDNRVLIWDPDDIEAFDYKAAGTAAQLPPPKVAATLEGHRRAVWSVAFSEDGERLISGSLDNSVNVWDVKTGGLIKTLRGHAGSVRSCQFYTDDSFAVSGSLDRTVARWNIEKYEEVRILRHVLKGHRNAIHDASFSHDGRQVVTASLDGSAKLWDLDTGQSLRDFREGHEYMASGVLFFPDGRRLLTTAGDNTVRIWDISGGTEVAGFEVVDFEVEHMGLGGAVALSSDGRWILTGGGRIDTEGRYEVWMAKLWDAETHELVHTLKGHKTEVTAVAISPDTRTLFTGDWNGRCVLWDRETGKEIERFYDEDKINVATFLPDGKRVLTASNYKEVRRWLVPSGEEDPSWALRHPDSVASMAVSGDGRLILTSCADGRVRLWDADRPDEPQELDVRGGKAVFAQNLRRYMSDFKWDEEELAKRCQLSESLVSDLLAAKAEASPQVTQKLAAALELPRPTDLHRTIFSVAIKPDGTRGMTVSEWDRVVRLWDLTNGEEVQYRNTSDRQGPFLDLGSRAFRGRVSSAAFSPADERVVTVGGDSARLWKLDENVSAQERELRSFRPHGAVSSAQFSPGGKYVVTGGWDNSARIWDAETGKVLRKLGQDPDKPEAAHRGKIRSAFFSPDGDHVLTASDDRTAKVWSQKDGSLKLTIHGYKRRIHIHGHKRRIHHAVYSHDGRLVMTSSQDKTTKIWDAESGKLRFTLAGEEGHKWAVLHAAFSEDDKWVVTGSVDNTAKVWRLEQGVAMPTPKYTLTGHTDSVTSVAFSPFDPEKSSDAENGGADCMPSRILTGSEDGTAILWDAQTVSLLDEKEDEKEPAKELLTLKAHEEGYGITSVSFSPDGRYALTSSTDGTAIVWLAGDWTETETERTEEAFAQR